MDDSWTPAEIGNRMFEKVLSEMRKGYLWGDGMKQVWGKSYLSIKKANVVYINTNKCCFITSYSCLLQLIEREKVLEKRNRKGNF